MKPRKDMYHKKKWNITVWLKMEKIATTIQIFFVYRSPKKLARFIVKNISKSQKKIKFIVASLKIIALL